jgi:glycosyltransferase involved in cell wall biosynthesis
MRILHVNARYWPYVGGAERHLQEICERQVREGHDVTVYTTDAYDLELFWSRGARRVPAPTEVHNGVRVVRFPVEHLPLSTSAFPAVRRGLVALSLTRLVPVRLLRAIAPLAPHIPSFTKSLLTTEERFDVVHGMNICFEGMLWPALHFARRTGAAFFVTPVTHLGEGESSRVRLLYTMRHQIALEAESDCVLTQTGIETAYLERRGVPRSLLVHAGAGINPEDLAGGDAGRF